MPENLRKEIGASRYGDPGPGNGLRYDLNLEFAGFDGGLLIYHRRELLRGVAFGTLAAAIGRFGVARGLEAFDSKRPPVGQRRFVSHAVEENIVRVKAGIGDPELAWMFENCYPNTLDTTVQIGEIANRPDTFVITGDIDAMWLRDSACQVWPYIPLVQGDTDLQRMFCGLIGRQTRSILLDPYANAFLPDPKSTKALSWAVNDLTEMKP